MFRLLLVEHLQPGEFLTLRLQRPPLPAQVHHPAHPARQQHHPARAPAPVPVPVARHRHQRQHPVQQHQHDSNYFRQH